MNFVFLQAKQQNYALSLTISLWELIVSDKNSQIYDYLKFELHEIASRRTNFGERSEPAPDRGGKLRSAGGRHKVTFRYSRAAWQICCKAIVGISVAVFSFLAVRTTNFPNSASFLAVTE